MLTRVEALLSQEQDRHVLGGGVDEPVLPDTVALVERALISLVDVGRGWSVDLYEQVGGSFYVVFGDDVSPLG